MAAGQERVDGMRADEANSSRNQDAHVLLQVFGSDWRLFARLEVVLLTLGDLNGWPYGLPLPHLRRLHEQLLRRLRVRVTITPAVGPTRYRQSTPRSSLSKNRTTQR